MKQPQQPPNRDQLIDMVTQAMYSSKILNNAHRGDVVEVMVQHALGPEWRLVSLGWHPWDIQKGEGSERIRLQVRQLALQQLWGFTKAPVLKFGWKKRPPSYFARDNSNEAIEPEGWFCEIFVIGLHLVREPEEVDQLDPKQWQFLVIPTSDLKPEQDSMVLKRALSKWRPVRWSELAKTVSQAAERCIRSRAAEETDP